MKEERKLKGEKKGGQERDRRKRGREGGIEKGKRNREEHRKKGGRETMVEGERLDFESKGL